MKNKPQRHKDSNVFKFKSFSERVDQIDVRHNALYHIQHVNEEQPDDNETHFRQAYGKWIVLNLSDEYNVFQRQIRDIVTLPQLLHKKDFVVELLLKSLAKATTLSLQPLLEFVVILAKDLREHFYPYFQSFLDRLILLLRTQDADQTEWTLICLAYLFKTLKPFLKKDITVVFNSIMPLLDRRNPEHVTNFAAECFSFVTRDMKDKGKFLELVLSGLKRHKNGTSGCGRLLFEIMRGVNGSVHSCAAEFLSVLLNSFRSDVYDHELLLQVMTDCVLNLVQNTNPTSMQVFWDVSNLKLNEFLDSKTVADMPVRNLLTLMGQAIEFRSGKLLCGPEVMIASLIRVVDNDVTDETLMVASQIVAVLLLSPNLNITQLDASRASRRILAIPSNPVFESFVWNVVNYSQFELLVLPEFLRYFEANFHEDRVLKLLTKIVLEKAPLTKDGICLPNWAQFPLRFKNEATLRSLEKRINNSDLSQSDAMMMCLILYPHAVGHDSSQIKKQLIENIEKICKLLEIDDDQLNNKGIDVFLANKHPIFLLANIIEAIIHMGCTEWLDQPKIIASILPYCQNIQYSPVMNILDQLITIRPTETLNMELFQLIHGKIADNLASQYHRTRRLTAHVLMAFGQLPELKQTSVDMNIYEIFYNVESTTASIQTYRDQLLNLQKLSADMQLFGTILDTVCVVDPLRYLLGSLYINFNLLWKPITALIASYCTALPLHQFWPIFRSRLDTVVYAIRHGTETPAQTEGIILTNDCVSQEFSTFWEINDRPDHLNYRILLWRMIPEFGQLREQKNREIVTMLFDFIDVEYKKSHENDSLCWDVQKPADESMTIDDDDDTDVNISKADQSKASGAAHKGTQRTLIAIVSVFATIANPSQIYRQPDLYALFLELLCHRNPHIQKLALECIMAYKHKYLLPYKEHLYGIIDEQKFKEAIATFKIEGEDNVVQPEHRDDLMPILMRILYSKMVAKQQKGGGQIRKTLVMRFLGSCREAEVLQLLKMAFRVYETVLKDETLPMVTEIMSNTNLASILSPKKMQSSLNLIEVIREQFGGLMGNTFLRYLLRVLFAIGAMVQGVLRCSHEIDPGHLKMFKNLRGLCLQSLANFFSHFDTYEWQQDELDTMFTVFITPSLSKLPNEGIHSATPLMKLLSVFGKNPRYFILLTKLPVVGAQPTEDETPMRYLIDLLLEPKTRPLVCLAVMEIIQSLLQLTDTKVDMTGTGTLIAPIAVTDCRPVERPQTLQHINFGSAILLPYVSMILEKFQQNLKKRRGLTKRDLLIVSRCTELVTDSATSSKLLEVLLPILVRKSHSNADEESLAQMVTTIKHLFAKIDQPERHIRDVAPMFEQITAVGPRKLLCDLIDTIAKRAGTERKDLRQMADIVKELNAWDKRWVEQPDYEKRLTAYKHIGNMQLAGELSMNMGLLAIYHSFYFIKHDKDLAMRDSACYHLKSLVPALARQFADDPKELEYLVGQVVLNLIRRTLNDKNDNVRNEGILLLGEMARECPEAHPVLQDLNLLSDRQDREVDFFDNITHLQHLRHGKALQRFCTVAKTFDRLPNSRTLTQFILPLATQYICTEKHATKHGVVTVAIETIGAVCRLLPWHQYESLLKYYLKKMRFNVEYQKQLVRLVMQILDSFHFDLSKAKMTKQELALEFAEQKQRQEEAAAARNALKEAKATEIDAELNDEEEAVLKDDENPEDELDLELAKEDLDDIDDDKNEEDEQPAKKIKVLVFDTATVLTHKAAKRLVHTIATGLIPQLNNSITVISTYESFHKLNKKKRRSEREEEEILRVPIALAMVKLLQKLPDGMLEHTLPGIFIKVCQFLKSPLKSVRMVTRDILKSIMLTVGSKHLDVLLHQMTTLLTRGFQVHVLTVTVYSIIDALKHTFKIGEIDQNMQSIMAVCLEDIFGRTAEEKDVKKIGINTPEAKPSNKSYLAMHIIASNITEACLLDMLIPFKDHLQRTQSKNVVNKVQECFQKIVMGLIMNKNIPLESLLMFIYGTASESIPDLLPGVAKPVLTEQEREKIQRARPDCFLIASEPRGRTGAIRKIVKTNVRANAHVIVEFGLNLLHIVLKRGKLMKIDYEPFVNPFVPILLDSLQSSNIRVTTYALKCLTSLWTREMKLAKLEELVPAIVPQMFSILHRYATAGMSASNDNFALVKNAFKAMVVLLRCVSYYTITSEQLKTLLMYVEQYLYDANKQDIAFGLLKVIVGRKLLVAEMNEVMRKISEIVIVAESTVSRQDAKGIMVNYLMDYPLGKKVDGFLKFFVSQLSYEESAGRESAIQLIHAIVKRFPQEVLNKKAGYLFLSLGARLVNDESADCRKLIAECVESLIHKLDANNRTQLFDIILVLLNDRKPSHREMAALLCSRFIQTEKSKFVDRIEKVLPALIGNLSMASDKGPGQFVRTAVDITEENSEEDEEGDSELRLEQRQRAKDHQLIQVLNTVLKIFETYPTVMEARFHQYIDELAYEAQKLLAYDHVWVRLSAAKVLDIILARLDVEALQQRLLAGGTSERAEDEESKRMDFLYDNPRPELKSLCLDLCAQMLPEVTDADMAEQVIKNLLYIANVVQVVELEKQQKDDGDEEEELVSSIAEEKPINLVWLIRRLRYVVHAEVAKAPHSIILRKAVFHWIEGLTELLPAAITSKLAPTLLAPIVREMSDDDKNIDPRLKQLAIKVGNSVRNQIGDDAYNLLRSQLQTKLMIKRAERKKLTAQVKVNDPVRAAMRKQGEKNRKKTAQKRKMDVLKGRALPKKKKVKRNIDADDMF